MLHFNSDYMGGACHEVLQALVDTNGELTTGYGSDPWCERARTLILEACGSDSTRHDVHFLPGGTQTNATAIAALLRPAQGVVAADTGHIAVHEAGAVEACGHKVLTLPASDGVLLPNTLQRYLDTFYADDTWQHMTIPGMLYISFPSELGTLYTLAQLEALADICHRHGMYLYIDGARLGYGLAASPDVTLRDIARLADAFYIGGTKQGALFGEALVVRRSLVPGLFTIIKQHGALMAKGRLLGVQFARLFTDDLYMRLSRHAVALAQTLARRLADAGYPPLYPSPTNQQFFRLPNDVVSRLSRVATFEHWGPAGETHSDIRLVTCWHHSAADIDTLCAALAGKTGADWDSAPEQTGTLLMRQS